MRDPDYAPAVSSSLPHDAWYAVAHTHEVCSTLSVRVLDRPVALFRRGPDAVGALLDRCPHRGAPLSDGAVHDGLIACPYHGWRFDADGRCRHLPGLVDGAPDKPGRAATPVAVHVQDGLVWVCPGTPPAAPPPRLGLVDELGTRTLRWRFEARCDAVDAIENFLDATHTHFVHPGLVRAEGRRRRVPVTVQALERGVEAVYQEAEQSGAIARLFGADITESVGRYLWPGLAQLDYRDGSGRTRLRITASFVPAGSSVEIVSVVTGRVPRLIPGWLAGALLAPFLKRTVAQDRAILERVARHRASLGELDAPPAISPLDLLRPHIDRLLRDPERRTPATPRSLELEL